MSQERFDYLLERFKADALSKSESLEWHAMVESGLYQAALEADIEAQLTKGAADPRWDAAHEAAAWQGIIGARDTLPSRKPIPLKWLWTAAACLLVALGVWWIVRPGSRGQELIARASRGGKTRVVLSDGTGVWLDAASTLFYPATFTGDDRRVRLEGQAYFEVSANSHSPFTVTTQGLTVEVLGTRFDLSDYPGDRGASAVLLEGSVRVRGANDSIVLRQSQQAIRRAGVAALILQAVDTAQVMAWKNNLFSFENTLLPDVAQELERWYDVRIAIDPAADTLQITGSISRQRSLKVVLDMLALTAGMHYTMEGKNIRLERVKK